VETASVERRHLAGACFGDFLGILVQDFRCDDASDVRVVQPSRFRVSFYPRTAAVMASTPRMLSGQEPAYPAGEHLY
jgi:hypothetical protein